MNREIITTPLQPHWLSFPSAVRRCGNGLAYGLFAYIPGLKARGFTRYIVSLGFTVCLLLIYTK